MRLSTPVQSDLIFEKCISIGSLGEINPVEILSVNEWEEYNHWKAESRKKQWLAGRQLCKLLIQEKVIDQTLPLNQIEILSRNNTGQSVRPEIRINGMKKTWALSISHTNKDVWVALSLKTNSQIGIDLVPTLLPDCKYLLQWFSAREKESFQFHSDEEIVQQWAFKEAIYKAVNNGESFSPLQIEIIKSTSGLSQYIVNGENITHRCRVQNRIQKKRFQNYFAVLVEIQNN